TLSSTLAAYPDLVVRGLGIVESTLTPGGTMTIRWNDVNQGAASTGANRYWYDLARVVDTTTGRTLTDGYVFSDWRTTAVGESLAREYAFTLPSDFDPATAVLEVTVTANGWANLPEYDASGSLFGNNASTIVWTATPTVPDLTVSGLTVDQTSLSAGGQVTVRWNDVNAGTGGTGSGWTDRIVVRNTTTNAVILDESVVSSAALAAGGSLAREFAFTLPTGANGVGEISITVTADSAAAIAESNDAGTAETNNSATINRTASVAADVDLGHRRDLPGRRRPAHHPVDRAERRHHLRDEPVGRSDRRLQHHHRRDALRHHRHRQPGAGGGREPRPVALVHAPSQFGRRGPAADHRVGRPRQRGRGDEWIWHRRDEQQP
ncbi:MAG: hypothetical protein EBZ59_12140, partial [Planctomycetia bacterium]|nr:hypothetical protein [Planctomycetia bacterium]